MRHIQKFSLRWSDMDSYGHVNSVQVVRLYEEARVSLLFRVARSAGVTSFEEGLITARHEIDYYRPLQYLLNPDHPGSFPTVRIESWIENIKAAQFTFMCEMYKDWDLTGRARSLCVPYIVSTNSLRRLTPAERSFLQSYVHHPDPPRTEEESCYSKRIHTSN
ncbi:acyl-CoA thioesterase [Streptomyces sp. NPDC059215]|uniref:acyl-CoA thioesterase n=1 Tax=Streptomyces sp. NPDC059215 TaxID=3346772 RepID=UPI00368950B6